jgi:DNA gyrase inhibitor GyrI
VKARHEGELCKLKDSFSQITQYLDMHKLSPITPFFCKVLTGLEDPENVQDMIADIYVGVNGNIF